MNASRSCASDISQLDGGLPNGRPYMDAEQPHCGRCWSPWLAVAFVAIMAGMLAAAPE
jgi:hypothetical protein